MNRRWRVWLVTGIMLAAAAFVLPGSSSAGGNGLTAAPAGARAMWLWSNSPAAEVVNWAALQNVSEIFVYVAPKVLTNGDLARLQQMRQRAGAKKITLQALGGDSSWTTDHAAALAWEKAVVTTGLFDGIHLDVEPYLTTGWSTDLQSTEKSFLTLLDKMRAASRLPIEADVPFWYGEYQTGGRNLADEVLNRVHAVTVMSYRDTADGPNSVLVLSQDWLRRGTAATKRVRLGVETGEIADCGYCTFYGDGAARLGRELAKVDAGTRQSSAYAGIAVHRYVTWRALKP
ncbi:MAG: hypothetical protein QOC94_2006 [Actinoplanes sp.]|nr:hypothetical protein [Actinoplanes sp.]